MEIIEFEKHVLEKWNPTLDNNQTLMNCILGITGEFLEVVEADNDLVENDTEENKTKLKDELGDLIFYIFRWQLATGTIVVTKESSYFGSYNVIHTSISKLLGEIKKFTFHGKEFSVLNFNPYITNLYKEINGLLSMVGFDIEEVMIYNVDKLNKRHGNDGFKTFANQNNS